MLSRSKLKIGAVLFALLPLVIMFVVLRQGWIVKILAKRSLEVLYFVETQEPVVALTIDDGPDPVATPEILDVLRQHDARATFFLITDFHSDNHNTIRRPFPARIVFLFLSMIADYSGASKALQKVSVSVFSF